MNTTNNQKFYINGQWVNPHSKQLLDVINPANEEIITQIAIGNEEDLNNAVEAAKKSFETWSVSGIEERLKLLNKLKEIYQKRFDEMTVAITTEMGCPKDFSSDVQTQSGLDHLNDFIEQLKNFNFENKFNEKSNNYITHEPIGVCGLITPWNWPINQITLKVLPALATGCTCILKPSEHTPLSAIIYAEMIDEAGYPAGVFNLINGDGPTVGSELSKHPDIQMMSFTGSTRAGICVTKDSADTVKRVTLELGGKSPNLVFSDCDLEERVNASVNECMFNTGQSCDAPTRLLVEESCYEEVLKIAKDACDKVLVDSPKKEGDHIGPLFDKIQFERVQTLINAGIDEGATLLCGGPGKPEGFENGWFVKPTIFKDVTNDMKIAKEEIFGPVLVIIPFKDEDEAIEIANDTPYGLAAYLQTGSEERAKRVAAKLRAGAVHINGGEFNYGSPFGGYKQSGNGREGGIMGLEDYLESKTLHY